jgi:uncharacterized protein
MLRIAMLVVHRETSSRTGVGPGTTAVFSVGRQGTWTIHETLRKAFGIYR